MITSVDHSEQNHGDSHSVEVTWQICDSISAGTYGLIFIPDPFFDRGEKHKEYPKK